MQVGQGKVKNAWGERVLRAGSSLGRAAIVWAASFVALFRFAGSPGVHSVVEWRVTPAGVPGPGMASRAGGKARSLYAHHPGSGTRPGSGIRPSGPGPCAKHASAPGFSPQGATRLHLRRAQAHRGHLSGALPVV